MRHHLQEQGTHETDGAEGNRGHETGVKVSCGIHKEKGKKEKRGTSSIRDTGRQERRGTKKQGAKQNETTHGFFFLFADKN